ncbi:TIGR00645 family protein [Cryobacterium sp. TMT1-66-1]|uniref:TIGR00645 family protein n=1 Tax=Cryobacterium sp. TMT1-66-1 TaxID=1259242 RepID=UPI00106CE781|nr:TIGR00645 family protein [Cryobacterium sp. TMT1-66-1]TFD03459.1 TIGR00645 family protein [Cryobacterium sp. TMT1-66-1]
MTETALPRPFRPQSRWVRSVGLMIFFSRWLQAPLYIGLIIAQIIYVIVFMVELINLGGDVWTSLTVPSNDGGIHVEEAAIMLSVLGLIDVVMIANLLIMVIIGGYETFVSRIRLEGHPDQPEWLSHVNANVLKVKLAMAIVGISSIHLLKTFIEVGDLAARGTPVDSNPTETITGNVYTWDGVLWQVIIHMVFILSAIALAWIDRMSQAGHAAPALAPSPVHGPAVAPGPIAALTAAPIRRELAPAASTGIAVHLTQLGQLRDAGVVTDAEFLAKKTELLARY